VTESAELKHMFAAKTPAVAVAEKRLDLADCHRHDVLRAESFTFWEQRKIEMGIAGFAGAKRKAGVDKTVAGLTQAPDTV
jgi:hypothetical protein